MNGNMIGDQRERMEAVSPGTFSGNFIRTFEKLASSSAYLRYMRVLLIRDLVSCQAMFSTLLRIHVANEQFSLLLI